MKKFAGIKKNVLHKIVLQPILNLGEVPPKKKLSKNDVCGQFMEEMRKAYRISAERV